MFAATTRGGQISDRKVSAAKTAFRDLSSTLFTCVLALSGFVSTAPSDALTKGGHGTYDENDVRNVGVEDDATEDGWEESIFY